MKNHKDRHKTMDLLGKNFIVFTLCALLILPVAVKGIGPKEDSSVSGQGIGKSTPCKCVVFRLDDVKGGYLDPVQIKIMNLFLSKEAHLTLGLVMQSIGNDSSILNRISEGYEKGLFELALHGWKHNNYANLSLQEQTSALYKANERMLKIFGNRSDIFIPPYDKFNNATLMVMKELGIKILSSTIEDQYRYDNGSSIFISNGKKQNASQSREIYFLPSTTGFKKFVGTSQQVKIPVEKVAKDIYTKIDKFGYAIVLIHPQNFIKLDKSGNYTDPVKMDVNQAQINHKDMKDLEYLLTLMFQKGIVISSFHKILDDMNS